MPRLISMLGSALLVLGLVAPKANAIDVSDVVEVAKLQASAMVEARVAGLEWHVGDKTMHSIKGGFINGKLNGFVREDTGSGFWVQQDADLGPFGKQKVEILFDKVDGSIKKLLVNGEEKNPPDPSRMEVLETKAANVTVSAGTFDCLYAKIRDTQSGDISEVWMNAEKVPMVGLIQSINPSQIGKITTSLLSFEFGH